jgi:acyl-CoA thioester hydrolase
MPAIFEHAVRVEAGDIDALGHANNLAYLRWALAAAAAHTATQGWPEERYIAEGRGWVVRSHTIEYLKPAGPGDELVVRTWVADMKKATSLRRYEILRSGTLLARAETDWAFVDFRTLAPTRIPPEVSGAFEVVDPGSGS